MTQRFRRKTGLMRVVLLALLLLSFFATTSTKAEEPVHAPSVTERPASSKPFWIDKGIFTSEDWLFVVGVATGSTQEDARSMSLDAAKRELTGHLKNYSDMQGLETKELWEEKNPANGTFTTYRLLVLKLRDWTPLLVDKSRVEEIAQILARIEERKAKEATDAEKAKAAKELLLKRAQVLHISDIDVWAYSRQCEMKDSAVQGWLDARKPESRKWIRERVERKDGGWLLMEGPYAEYGKRIERQVDYTINQLKRDADRISEVCEMLKEADVLIAQQEQKKAEPLKRLRYWEERLWKERFPNGHPAGAEAEAKALASPRK
jgi:hypothetical protein